MTVNRLRRREIDVAPSGWAVQVHPVLQRVYAARGVPTPNGAEHRLARLLAPNLLGGIDVAVALLDQAIRDNASIVIAGDPLTPSPIQ